MSASSSSADGPASSASPSASRRPPSSAPSLGLITAPPPRNVAGHDPRSTLSGKDRAMHERITWPANGNLSGPKPPPVSSFVFPPSHGPIPRLPSDLLGAAFSYLRFAELCSVVKVCRDWHDAVSAMLPLQDGSVDSIWFARVGRAIPGPQSPLAQHVRLVDGSEIKTGELFVLSRRLPNVLRMHLRVALSGSRLYFPAGLIELTLNLTFGDPSADEIEAALVDVSALPLLQSFKLHVNMPQPDLSLVALQQCASLRNLALWSWDATPTQLSDQQVDDLRALVRLDYLDVFGLDAALMRRLLRRPHALQWKELRGFPQGLQSECADLLAWLPSLTKIDESDSECGSVDFMEDLPALRFVHLRCDPLMSARAVMDGLKHLTQVTNLRLVCSPLDADQLSSVLSVMPLLSSLDLRFSTALRSLSFLDAIPTDSQLLALTLYGDHQMPQSDLRHVHRFQRLQRLTLSHVFDAALDSAARSLFVVPSSVLPSLRDFSLQQQGDDVDRQYQLVRHSIPEEAEEEEHRV